MPTVKLPTHACCDATRLLSLLTGAEICKLCFICASDIWECSKLHISLWLHVDTEMFVQVACCPPMSCCTTAIHLTYRTAAVY